MSSSWDWVVSGAVGVTALTSAWAGIQKLAGQVTWPVVVWRRCRCAAAAAWAAYREPARARHAERMRAVVLDATVGHHDAIRSELAEHRRLLESFGGQFEELDRYVRYHLGPNGTAVALFSRVAAAQEATERGQAIQRAHLDAISLGVMEADTDQLTVAANRAAQQILGAPSEGHLLGRGWERYIRPEHLPRLTEEYDRSHAQLTEAEWRRIETIDPATGEVTGWYDSDAKPVIHPGTGELISFLGTLRQGERFANHPYAAMPFLQLGG
jgi:PAS domain-containing protein